MWVGGFPWSEACYVRLKLVCVLLYVCVFCFTVPGNNFMVFISNSSLAGIHMLPYRFMPSRMQLMGLTAAACVHAVFIKGQTT